MCEEVLYVFVCVPSFFLFIFICVHHESRFTSLLFHLRAFACKFASCSSCSRFSHLVLFLFLFFVVVAAVVVAFLSFPVLLIGLDDLCKSHHFNTPKTNQRAISHRARSRGRGAVRKSGRYRNKMDVLCVLHRNEEASTTK